MTNQSSQNFLNRLNSAYPNMTKTEKKIALFARENSEMFLNLSAKEIADLTGTSSATIVRFCRSCGYAGFNELKFQLDRERKAPKELRISHISREDSISEIRAKTFARQIKLIDSMNYVNIDEGLEAAVNALEKAEVIFVSGYGESRTIAYIFRDMMAQLGRNVEFESDILDELNRVDRLRENDVFFGITYSGRSRTTLEAMKMAHERGAVTIGLLGIEDSPMHKYSDISLLLNAGLEESYYGSMNNLIKATALLNALYMILAVRKNNLYLEEQRLYDIAEHLRISRDE